MRRSLFLILESWLHTGQFVSELLIQTQQVVQNFFSSSSSSTSITAETAPYLFCPFLLLRGENYECKKDAGWNSGYFHLEISSIWQKFLSSRFLPYARNFCNTISRKKFRLFCILTIFPLEAYLGPKCEFSLKMAEISTIFSEILHFGPKYASRGKTVNIQKMRFFILDMGMQKFLVNGRNFCLFYGNFAFWPQIRF